MKLILSNIESESNLFSLYLIYIFGKPLIFIFIAKFIDMWHPFERWTIFKKNIFKLNITKNTTQLKNTINL